MRRGRKLGSGGGQEAKVKKAKVGKIWKAKSVNGSCDVLFLDQDTQHHCSEIEMSLGHETPLLCLPAAITAIAFGRDKQGHANKDAPLGRVGGSEWW